MYQFFFLKVYSFVSCVSGTISKKALLFLILGHGYLLLLFFPPKSLKVTVFALSCMIYYVLTFMFGVRSSSTLFFWICILSSFVQNFTLWQLNCPCSHVESNLFIMLNISIKHLLKIYENISRIV